MRKLILQVLLGIGLSLLLNPSLLAGNERADRNQNRHRVRTTVSNIQFVGVIESVSGTTGIAAIVVKGHQPATSVVRATNVHRDNQGRNRNQNRTQTREVKQGESGTQTRTFSVDPLCAIFLKENAPGKASDLQVGDHVAIAYKEALGDQLIATDIRVDSSGHGGSHKADKKKDKK